MENQSKRIAIAAFFSICAIFALINANLAIFLALIAGFFLIKQFGLLEYTACGLILLAKSQDEIVLSSVDLAGNVINYNLIAGGHLVMDGFHWGDYEDGEIILPSVYWLLSRVFPDASEPVFAFFFVFTFLILFYPLLRTLHCRPIVLLFVMLFLDVNLIVHLFRQSLATLLLLIALLYWFGMRKTFVNRTKAFVLVMLSCLIHLTNIIFLPLTLLFKTIPLFSLKLVVVLAGYFAFAQDGGSIFKEVLALTQGLPVLGKMSYALIVWENESGLRPQALLAIVISLFIKEDNPYLRIFLGFSALTLIVYDVPILCTRVGYISSSIITGLPIGMFALQLRRFLVKLNKPTISTRKKLVLGF